MTANRRIVLNIVATYGRSLYALAIGLFCGRWTLMALGQVDYGLMGVVGGLTAFIGFFFGILSGAVGRFYAIAIGKASVAGDAGQGLEECREWFSLAVTIHVIIPFILMAIGYPIGEWAVRHYLVVPPDRVEACVWVFRFVCVSSLLGMVGVPFNAMYGAKQYIAELTVYSFATATLNVCFLYYMVTHPGVWLARFALWTCLLSIGPSVIIAVRACQIFPECRYRWKYRWNWSKYKQMLSYTGWNTVGSLGCMLRVQGVAILVNKFFGPSVNAAMGIANTVSAQTQTLAGAMQGAFSPVIATAVGAGDMDAVRSTSLRFCKFGMALSLLFMIPLTLELPGVVELWLKNPPRYTVGLCWIMLLMAFVDKNTLGQGVAIMAYGKIMWYQIVLGIFNLMALPCAWLFVKLGGSVYSVGWAMLLTWSALVYGRVFFARRLLRMSIRKWLVEVMAPVILALVLAGAIGFLPHFFMDQSLMRIVVTTIFSEIVFVPLLWAVVLNRQEREFVLVRIHRIFGHG